MRVPADVLACAAAELLQPYDPAEPSACSRDSPAALIHMRLLDLVSPTLLSPLPAFLKSLQALPRLAGVDSMAVICAQAHGLAQPVALTHTGWRTFVSALQRFDYHQDTIALCEMLETHCRLSMPQHSRQRTGLCWGDISAPFKPLSSSKLFHWRHHHLPSHWHR